MTEPNEERRILVVGPDGTPVAVPMLGPGAEPTRRAASEDNGDLAEAAVGEPAKVMRIGTMIKQLLEEVRAAPLDEASRMRLKQIHQQSIRELEAGLSTGAAGGTGTHHPAVHRRRRALRRRTPHRPGAAGRLAGGGVPRLQAALVAQQMAARMQLDQMRRGGALPPGASPDPGREPGAPAPGSTCRYRYAPAASPAPSALSGSCSDPVRVGPPDVDAVEKVQDGHMQPATRDAAVDGTARTRVLVVEDEPSIAALVRMYLEREGFGVDIAADGRRPWPPSPHILHRPSCWTSGYPGWTASRCAGGCEPARGSRRRSCSSPPETRRSTASSGSSSAAMTTSPSRSPA